MEKAALMQRIEQHFGAKAVTRSVDLAVLLEDICWHVYQWALDDARSDAAAAQVTGAAPEKTTIVAELKVVLDQEIISVVGFLLDVAQAAHQAMQDCEDCGDHYRVQREDFDNLNAAMEKLEALPDDRPGYTLSGPGKAEWALRDRGEATDGEIYEGYSKRADPAAHKAALDESLALLPQPVAEQGELPPPVLTVEIFRRGRTERHEPNQNYYTAEHMRAAIAASQQAKEIDHGDIFDLIREWARLPEGQRHDAARAIIGRMNQSYAAGVADGKVLGAAIQQPQETPAARDVLAERRRQVEQEGWAAARDDGYVEGELSRAAACYAGHASAQQRAKVDLDIYRNFLPAAHHTFGWPWAIKWWKPKDPRRDLVKAGALILAEIERLDRHAESSVCAGTGTAFGKACECKKGASHG